MRGNVQGEVTRRPPWEVVTVATLVACVTVATLVACAPVAPLAVAPAPAPTNTPGVPAPATAAAPEPDPPRQPPAKPVAVQWQRSNLASVFWFVDNLSAWSSMHTHATYLEALTAKRALTRQEEALLDAYRNVRKAHSKAKDDREVVADLLPPQTSPADRFALPFVTKASAAEATAALGLAAKERAAVSAALAHFEKVLARLRGDAAYLEVAEGQLRQLADEAKLEEFLGRAARFYGVTEAVEKAAPLTVQLVWSPEASIRATQLGPVMVIPLPPSYTGDTKELAGMLGVTVHEFGHYFVGLTDEGTRRRANDVILGRLGVVNRHHPNVIDEATQTALGNVLFLKQRLFAAYDAGSLYAYEPDGDYPYAIDSLARAAAPHLARALDVPSGFSSRYLLQLAEEHQRLFPPSVRHHTRILNVYCETRRIENRFVGLFPALSRTRFSKEELPLFLTQSGKQRVPRFAVLTAATAAHEKLGDLSRVADAAREALSRHPRGACLSARWDAARGAYDFVALGDDDDALRRLLIAMHRGLPIPEGKPSCVGAPGK